MMTNKQRSFGIFMFVLLFTYEPLLFSMVEVSRRHEWLFFLAYSSLLLAGMLKLSIIVEDVINGRYDQ